MGRVQYRQYHVRLMVGTGVVRQSIGILTRTGEKQLAHYMLGGMHTALHILCRRPLPYTQNAMEAGPKNKLGRYWWYLV